jgi:ATP-dependent RNA helicase RhlE
MHFNSFSFQPELLRALTALNYEAPTPIQAQTIPLLLEGRDVIGCAQTGTGKTAAFALPILQQLQPGQRLPQALIVTPTRELAEQIDVAIKGFSRFMRVRSAAIYGGVKAGPQENQLRQGLDIVVATPGRLLDHLRNGVLNLKAIRFLVLDEADRMLDMGFMPDIRRIVSQLPTERQTLLYSATMPPEIEKIGRSLTRQAQLVLAGPRNTTAHSVRQGVYRLDKTRKLRLLVHVLRHAETGSTIVFSRTRHGADRIARQLGRQGIDAARIHADRSQAQRLSALESFRSGACQVLVATDIAARGLDIENVTHVINYDTPVHAEDYVHRIGRTGRAAATGDALTFTSEEEDKYLRSIEKLIGQPVPVLKVPDVLPELAAPPPQTTSHTPHKAATKTAPRAATQNADKGRRPAQALSQRTPAARPQTARPATGRPAAARPTARGRQGR